jgi:hypothetical protein
MELKFNTHQMPTTPPPSTKRRLHTYRRLQEPSYYGRAVGNTILPALSVIATEQAQPTEKTKEILTQLLDYCATQEEAIITYSASKMMLAVHSDAGYCNEKKSHSQAGGIFFLSNDNEFPPNIGAILTIANIIKAVMSSAMEAELGALYLNAKEAVYI